MKGEACAIKDIKGYWSMSEDYNFNDKDMWEGQLILCEDGWFEGIVQDPYSYYTDDRFIFGAYLPRIAIELLKITPADVSDPFVFRGEKSQEGFDCIFSSIGIIEEYPLGVSHIITKKSANKNPSELQARINNWKVNMRGDENSLLYENSAKMRNELCEMFRRKYTGKRFTDEEMNKIREVADPIEKEILRMIRESFSRACGL
jgi:hypothetical protein